MQRIIKLLFILSILTIGVTSVQASPGYVSLFTAAYPNATSIANCGLCHVNPAGGGTRNSFGLAFAAAGDSFTAAVGSAASRCSGYTNLQLINLGITPGDGTTCPTAQTTCTSFTYSTWGTCQSNNTQTRTVATSSPAGCTGGTPVTSQSCTYVPPVTTCSSFTYSAWGACQSNNTQTRTVTASSPAGCAGGTPVTSQSCTYVLPQACTSYTYTLGACQPNGTAPVTSYTGIPAGCSGGATPATSQSCTYVPTTCSSFTYSAWGACQSNNTQTRTVTISSPAGCTGGTPVTSQSCTYTASTSAQIGVFRNGTWYLDMNQNMMWDPGVDAALPFGMAGDIPVVGDWNGNGIKKIGVFRNGTWYLDTDGNNSWDASGDAAISFGMAGDIPVVGDWNGDGKTKIGVFRNGTWYLDYPGTGSWVGCGAPADPTKDACISYGMAGDIPVVGDWNGNGKIKIGVFRNGTWYLGYPGTGSWVGCGAPADPTKDACISYGMAGDIPVVGDWNGNGKIKIGVFRNGTWYLDVGGNKAWDPGIDTVAHFGMAGDNPIVR